MRNRSWRIRPKNSAHVGANALEQRKSVQKRLVVSIVTSAVSAALAGCGGGGGSPGPVNTPPPIITFSHTFAPHQTTAVKGTPWQITGITTTLSGAMYNGGSDLYDTLRVDVAVSPSIANALPAPGSQITGATQIAVGVAIDSDGNVATGGIGNCVPGSGITPYEFLSGGAQRLLDGNYSISSASGVIYTGDPNPAEEAVVGVSNGIISESFFLPTIHVFSGRLIPHVGVSVVTGNGVDIGITDCEPAGGGEVFTDHQ